MKKKFLLVLTSAILLSGCNLNISDLLERFTNQGGNTTDQTSDENENQGSEHQEQHEEQQEEQHEEQEEHHEDDHQDDEHQEEHHEDDDHQDDDDHEEEEHGDYQYSLNDYTDFAWHDGHKPCYAPDWEYHIKDTVNPLQSAFWENPNENVDYSGVIFKDRNSYIISPTFKSWKKVEVRLSFWFSANQKEATKDAPQMYIEEYSSTNQLLGKEEINISRSDVPSNNTPYVSKHYLKNTSMSYFILRHNNYVYNGNNASYYLVLTEATLKGWDYE